MLGSNTLQSAEWTVPVYMHTSSSSSSSFSPPFTNPSDSFPFHSAIPKRFSFFFPPLLDSFFYLLFLFFIVPILCLLFLLPRFFPFLSIPLFLFTVYFHPSCRIDPAGIFFFSIFSFFISPNQDLNSYLDAAPLFCLTYLFFSPHFVSTRAHKLRADELYKEPAASDSYHACMSYLL